MNEERYDYEYELSDEQLLRYAALPLIDRRFRGMTPLFAVTLRGCSRSATEQ